MTTDLTDDFVTLFRGRGDAYGAWDGGCIKQPLTRAIFHQHLYGDTGIGVYCSVPSGDQPFCVWGCTDIDYPSFDDATLLQKAFTAVGVTTWVERTRKGYHIWLFCDQPVSSLAMRNAQLAAHQVVGLNPKEVNPKQANVTVHSYGNYVRLPYPAIEPHQRFMVDTSGAKISLEEFVPAALAARTTPDKIEFLAGHYQPPKHEALTLGEPTADMTSAASMLTPLGRIIWRNGPREGRDRSTTLQHLAHECRKAQIAPSDALMLVKDADTRWGKYSMRGAAGEIELEKLVARAYGPTPSP